MRDTALDYVARTPEQLARILKSTRAQRKMTQRDVASRVGIKQSTVSVIEADASRARVETLYKLLSALGLELSIRERGSSLASRRTSAREW